MLTTHTYKSARWIDIVEPTPEDISHIVERHGIDSFVAHELGSPSERHRMEARATYLYLILHFPVASSDKSDRAHEIDFIVGSDFLITTRYEQIDAVDRFSKKLEVESILHKEFPGNPRDLILFGLLKEIVQDIRAETERIEESLKTIEDKIFHGSEKKMVIALSEASRRILDLKKIILPYRDVLKELEVKGVDMFGGDFGFLVRGAREEFIKSDALVRNLMDSLTELRETNNSLLETKENDLMKFIAILSLVTSVMLGAALVFLELRIAH